MVPASTPEGRDDEDVDEWPPRCAEDSHRPCDSPSQGELSTDRGARGGRLSAVWCSVIPGSGGQLGLVIHRAAGIINSPPSAHASPASGLPGRHACGRGRPYRPGYRPGGACRRRCDLCYNLLRCVANRTHSQNDIPSGGIPGQRGRAGDPNFWKAGNWARDGSSSQRDRWLADRPRRRAARIRLARWAPARASPHRSTYRSHPR